MNEIDLLLQQYARLVGMPWQNGVSGAEKVWFVVYEPAQERRLQLRRGEFQMVTEKAGHVWKYVDLTDAFARWMAEHRYRESYFKQPELLTDAALSQFAASVADQIKRAWSGCADDGRTVVAIGGLGALFGIVRASDILGQVTQNVAGRLLVFFPGGYKKGVYRLLDARDGWNYLAIPIIADMEG